MFTFLVHSGLFIWDFGALILGGQFFFHFATYASDRTHPRVRLIEALLPVLGAILLGMVSIGLFRHRQAPAGAVFALFSAWFAGSAIGSLRALLTTDPAATPRADAQPDLVLRSPIRRIGEHDFIVEPDRVLMRQRYRLRNTIAPLALMLVVTVFMCAVRRSAGLTLTWAGLELPVIITAGTIAGQYAASRRLRSVLSIRPGTVYIDDRPISALAKVQVVVANIGGMHQVCVEETGRPFVSITLLTVRTGAHAKATAGLLREFLERCRIEQVWPPAPEMACEDGAR